MLSLAVVTNRCLCSVGEDQTTHYGGFIPVGLAVAEACKMGQLTNGM